MVSSSEPKTGQVEFGEEEDLERGPESPSIDGGNKVSPTPGPNGKRLSFLMPI